MNAERQQYILEILKQRGEVQLRQLTQRFPEVSMMTLRRDLTSLENEGYLIRTHGGAVSASKLASLTGEEYAYSRRAAENIDSKLRIAEKTAGLVETGRSLYFDAGSTVMCLARILPDNSYSIITSGANTAIELVKKQKISVMTLGGLINRNTYSVSGPNAIAMIEAINIDIAFMSASGFSVENGFTVSNVYECELKKRVVSRSSKVVILMDTSKINRNMAYTFATLQDIDIWAAEAVLPEDIRKKAESCGIKLL